MELVDLPPRKDAVEWPTAALAALIYGLWLALTYWHDELPRLAADPRSEPGRSPGT